MRFRRFAREGTYEVFDNQRRLLGQVGHARWNGARVPTWWESRTPDGKLVPHISRTRAEAGGALARIAEGRCVECGFKEGHDRRCPVHDTYVELLESREGS